MDIHLAPSPIAVAGRIGAGLRASQAALHAMVPREVAVVVKTAGPTAAWALVDGRFEDRDPVLVNWGIVIGDLSDTERDRFRRLSLEIGKLHPVLRTLADGLPANHQVGVAYVGPGGGIGGLGELLRDDDTMSFIAPGASDHSKKVCARASDLVDQLLEVSGSSRLVIATDGSVGRGVRGAGAGWVDSWGGYGAAVVGTSQILVAELVAMGNALAELPKHVTSVTVWSDSRTAIDIARQSLSSGATSGPLRVPARAHGACTRIHDAGKKVPVTFEWVRGHSGDLMNETADRLAVTARRCLHAGLSAEHLETVTARIVQDYWTGNTLGGLAAA